MRRHIPFVIVLMLCPAMLLAQTGDWESMPVPYFVSYVNGASIGLQSGTQYTYMIGSNLEDTIIYCTNGAGAESWPANRQVFVHNANHLSACRNDGLYAASTVSYPAFQAGVHFTADGGQSWDYDPDHQPENSYFRCVAFDPTDGGGVVVIGNYWGYQPTIWRQLGREQAWESFDPDPPGINDPEGWTNSLRYFRVGNQTELYACKLTTAEFDHSNLWRVVDDGVIWDEIGTAGSFGIEVKDFARTPGANYPHYFVLYETGSGRGLKHSTNLQNWSLVSDFSPPADGLNIIVTSANDDDDIADTLWLLSSSQLIILTVSQNGGATQLASFAHGGNSFSFGAIDFGPSVQPGDSHPTIYVGRRWSFEQFRYNSDYSAYVNYYLLDGTNLANIVAISEAGAAVENGGGLYALGEQGGFVFINKKEKDPNWPNIWEAKNSVLRDNAAFGTDAAIGVDISTYYLSGAARFIAVANNQGGTRASVLNNGVVVGYSSEIPVSLNACTGRKIPLSIVAANPSFVGSSETQNCVWKIYNENEGRYLRGGADEPELSDVWLIEDTFDGFSPFSVGGPPNDNNAVFDDYFQRLHVDAGLGNVDVLSSVMASGEDPTSGQPILYAGVQSAASGNYGVYKNHFNYQESSPWYRISYGMSENWPVLSLVTTKHLIDCEESIDPLVVYALEKNPSTQDRYLYISADSGRSWVESGQYLRDNDILVDKLELTVDEGTDQRYYLAASGEDGIFRYPYNVKSGDLTQSEIWGPGIIIVNGDVTVPSGRTLTINAGTTIKFIYGFDKLGSGSSNTKSEILVYGALLAQGNTDNEIVFESSRHELTPGNNDWYGIYAGVGSDITMAHCIVREADYGIYAYKVANLTVTSCLFEEIKNAGIYMSLYAQSNPPEINYCRMHACGMYGIRCISRSFTAYKDTVEDCLYGISYTGDSSPLIDSCQITCAPLGISYYGIYASKTSMQASPTVTGCYVQGFSQGGIYLNGVSNSGLITNTTVYQSGVYGIYCLNSSPGLLGGTNTRNFIHGNAIGIWLASSSSPNIKRTKLATNLSKNLYISSGCWPNVTASTLDEANSFISISTPGYYDLYNANVTTIQATGNYWGESFPEISQIYNAAYIPYVGFDPLRRMESPGAGTLAQAYEVAKAYPNPFNAQVRIDFSVDRPQYVSVNVFNIMGQKIKTMVDEFQEAGTQSVIWDGTNQSSEPVSTGIYFCLIQAEDKVETLKLLMLK